MKFAHQWSCGWALYCSHCFREGPPTTMIHSPFGTLSPPKAFGARGRIDSEAMRRRRFIEYEGKQYLCRKRKSATCTCSRLALSRRSEPDWQLAIERHGY